MSKHPMQPVEMVGDVARFKENPIVTYLLENGRIDLNQIGILAQQGKFSRDDENQFAQLHGYSVSGWGDLGYANKKTVRKADRRVEKLIAQMEEDGHDE